MDFAIVSAYATQCHDLRRRPFRPIEMRFVSQADSSAVASGRRYEGPAGGPLLPMHELTPSGYPAHPVGGAKEP